MIPRIRPILNTDIIRWLTLKNVSETDEITAEFISALKNNYNFEKILFFDSGRSALSFCLKNIRDDKRNEVIVSAFTCSAVADAVINSGLRPVFADNCITDFSIELESLKKCVNKNTLAVVYPHHFGIGSEKILEITGYLNEKNIFLIEDIAQSIFCYAGEKKAGSIGDFAIMSFGLDKPISCGQGGALLINNEKTKMNYFQDYKYESEIKEIQDIISLIITHYFFCNPNYNCFLQLETAERFIKKNRIYSVENLNEVLFEFEKYIYTESVKKEKKIKKIFNILFSKTSKVSGSMISKKKLYVLAKNYELFKSERILRNENAVKWGELINSKFSDKIMPLKISGNQSNHSILKYPALVSDKSYREEISKYFIEKCGIETGSFNWPYILPHRKLYRKYRNNSYEYKNALNISECIINFPVHSGLNFDKLIKKINF